ncbi:11977_t:CDS:2 [Ambispora gerdemannii]|uniref:11977_t:CDS:1 n=1 Tax=Ambispora gerdemannii TaxID=144530 RepID=A0A9N9AFP3_9GLOM|nr:11977_t:CDS:2 [Ambispora gerdemannii]
MAARVSPIILFALLLASALTSLDELLPSLVLVLASALTSLGELQTYESQDPKKYSNLWVKKESKRRMRLAEIELQSGKRG